MEVAVTKSELPSYPAVEMVVGAIADWINRYRDSVEASRDLQHCDPNEVMRMASDLGITPAELRELSEKGPRSAELLKRMLLALDVDPKAVARADPLVMRDLQRLCVTCDHKTRCAHELAQGSAAAHFHEFCPNAHTIDALLGARRMPS
jgi:hypothetical protein